ncbi:Trp biosynthesis-associated membrane protein [Pseudonocardia abyssalis]|uniref:Trp biosynthesis-associated membrane protein n=1 Tax=Pseudonocardia abyssalis TaxID=2792008 RepID=A0ABS6UMJ2_9PSEU|nr:Trp biosynthesis-associated membrane protein [Pseudonocardia abyssalis]MBW0117607.1 Trp biosynthesis-associated membrane protein [Pseudonocardia abyssalis]MBW0133460.1 Trp biosynthesis-associated membrane protein [Pseudonocardia abyssalis]
MTAPTGGAPSPRTLGLACAGLVAAAAALWGSSQALWFRVTTAVAGGGQQVVEVTGAQARPVLGGVALLALAGVAGLVATGGLLRRAVGLLLVVAGAAVGVAALTAAAPPGIVPAETTPAPSLAVLGGALLVAVGAVVLVRERRLPRLGARYAAPGSRPAPTDPDRAAWQDLDAGRDPTTGSD